MLGGLGHLTVDALGNVTPCVFVPVSYGNVLHEPFSVVFERMRRAFPRPLRSGCAALRLAQATRERGLKASEMPVACDRLGRDWAEPLAGAA